MSKLNEVLRVLCCPAMEKLRPEDPKAVMPYAKRLLQLSGFRQDTEQLGTRIYLNLFIFVAAILIPKVCFPYPDTEAMIRGLSELIFFTNIFVGLFCFIAQHRPYRELLNAIESFVNIGKCSLSGFSNTIIAIAVVLFIKSVPYIITTTRITIRTNLDQTKR